MKMIYGIGIGPGDKELLTLKGYRLIRTCDCVFVPESKGESLATMISHEYIKDKKIIELSFPMKEDNQLRYKDAAQKIDEVLREGEVGVFLTLGDPMTYSTYAYLMKELSGIGIETETIPGITSFNAAASILELPIALRDESFYLADGDIDEEILKRVDTVCVLKVIKNKESIIDKLEKHSFEVIYVKRCTQQTQRVIYDRQEMLEDKDYMSLIFARAKAHRGNNMVYFIGAGPGDVDLITVKGRRLLEMADIVVYAGSLVWEEHLKFCSKSCKTYNSASMTLEEVAEVILKAEAMGKTIVRLHTGDPTIYGAIREQMDYLLKHDIAFEVIPGVSSFTASCAAIKREFTLPGVSQTVIITRMEGRTPVPETESLELLAAHKCSMAIFLSVQDIEKVVEKLAKGYGSYAVPVAVVYKATWPEQKIIYGTLEDIADKVRVEGVGNFSQILVGGFIEGDYQRSQLYHPEFSHGFRAGVK